MRRHPEELSEVQEQYESFMREVRSRISPKLFSFETTAQLGSSLVLSLIVSILGVAYLYLGESNLSDFEKEIITICLIGSIILGIILTGIYYYRYSSSLEMLRKDEERIQFKKDKDVSSGLT